MTKPNDSPPEPIVNVDELLARVDNDAELLRELIAIFKTEFPRHLSALRQAIGQGDLKNIQKSAHTLKGMLLSLGATRAAAAAATLEHTSDDIALNRALETFESETIGLLPELEACLAKARP